MELDNEFAFLVAFKAVYGCARLSASHLLIVMHEESFSAEVYILELGSLSEVNDSRLFLSRSGFRVRRKGDQSARD
jgi:hypothetical protein